VTDGTSSSDTGVIALDPPEDIMAGAILDLGVDRLAELRDGLRTRLTKVAQREAPRAPSAFASVPPRTDGKTAKIAVECGLIRGNALGREIPSRFPAGEPNC
jgi:hypothetical protein